MRHINYIFIIYFQARSQDFIFYFFFLGGGVEINVSTIFMLN